jgi:hypothetical protein
MGLYTDGLCWSSELEASMDALHHGCGVKNPSIDAVCWSSEDRVGGETDMLQDSVVRPVVGPITGLTTFCELEASGIDGCGVKNRINRCGVKNPSIDAV